MKTIAISLSDIKGIKKLMDESDELKERSMYVDDLGIYVIDAGKTNLLDSKEALIDKNICIVRNLLKVDYDTVIDMCYDLDFAKQVLSSINK